MTCHKIMTFGSRKDARQKLLERWASGDFRLRRSHWCEEHQAWHLTSKTIYRGKGPADYEDMRS